VRCGIAEGTQEFEELCGGGHEEGVVVREEGVGYGGVRGENRGLRVKTRETVEGRLVLDKVMEEVKGVVWKELGDGLLWGRELGIVREGVGKETRGGGWVWG
uniref:hypothetical protein n=1 Tax=Kocuria salsicia TaxID=664639 RepID=UPI00164393F5